jgi:translocation and assembly module TamB
MSVPPPAKRLDPVRIAARLLCALFGLVGALPFVAEAVLAFAPAQSWAAGETRRVLQDQLGLEASYDVRIHLIPLRLRLTNLVVAANDGGGPALQVEEVSVRPRVFSLLAGKLDFGDIEIESPKARLVLADGRVKNVNYRVPKATGPGATPSKRAPFSSLSVSEARISLESDGTKLETGAMDLDVLAETGPTFEVLLRATESRITRTQQPRRPLPDASPLEVDEDVMCRLELRLRVEGKELLLRRLSTIGVADLDPAAGTRPLCSAPEDAKGRVAVRLSQVRVVPVEKGLPYVSGHVVVRAPLALTNRFVSLTPLDGWAGFAGDLRHDPHSKLPEIAGRVSGAGIAFGGYHLAKKLAIDVDVKGDVVRLPRYEMDFADGHVVAENISIEPTAPGVPISAERVHGVGMLFESMMRDLDVTPNTVVRWDLVDTRVTKIQGTLAPLKLDAELAAETRDFEVFDRAFHDPARRHMVGVHSSVLKGRFGVRPGAILFYDTRADFGNSSIYVKMVSVGFANELEIDIPPGARIDLADISPIADLPVKGLSELDVKLGGLASDPLLTGNLKVDGFEMSGFPIGDVKSAKVTFRPLWVKFSDVQGRKGGSDFLVPEAKLDFDAGPSLLVEARATSDNLDLRDFFEMWHFDEDPRFEPIKGKTAVNASIRYVIGGPEDRCKTGVLRTAGKMNAHSLDLFDEHYDGGEADFDFSWTDQAAGYRGVTMRVPRLVLRKGSGTLSGTIGLEPGALVSAEVVASSVPISKLDALPTLLRAAEGTTSAVATVSGTLDEMRAEVNATMTPIRLGTVTLPASEFSVRLEPVPARPSTGAVSKCGQPISGKFDRAEFDRDLVDGLFRVSGSLFGGRVQMNDVRVTRQRKKRVRGEVVIDRFDVGALAALRPGLDSASRPTGSLSGKVRIDDLEMADPYTATGALELTALTLARGAYRADLAPGSAPIAFSKRRFEIPRATLEVGLPGTVDKAAFDLAGSVSGVGIGSNVDVKLVMRPLKLSALMAVAPRIERANGSLSGLLQVQGPPSALRYAGGFQVESSELSVRGLSSPIYDLALQVKLDGRDLTITKGTARIGDGAIGLGGGLRLSGLSLEEARLRINAQKLSLPATDGIRAVADADLVLAYNPANEPTSRSLPRLTGNVMLRSFEYRRPIAMTAGLNALAQRGKRTEFEAYDPSEDMIAFDVAIRSERPLRIQNELIEANLVLADEGLSLAGTNGRFGLRGAVRIQPGGRIVLRRNAFEITDGTVKFNDTTRIHPDVDVTAETEYRRYSNAASATAQTSTTTTTGSSTSATGGRWNVRLHAYGDADNLKVDLTSDPALAQDDIFLLLTVGLTRAELDQAQSASVGESVALEALGTLTGADKAIKDAVPLIDEFRFGSTYSSRTGRTEPTVTIGKRLTERVRGNVTTGLAESREIRSNLEWQLSPRVSVEGSYDNVNDISSSSLGNLGTDIRWRLEFE